MKIPPRKKSVLSVAQEKTLPPPPGAVVAAVFQGNHHQELKVTSLDNSSDEESKDDGVESEDEIKLLPVSIDGLGKRLRKLWKVFMREELLSPE